MPSTRMKLCAVIGDPIEHSLSPTMHNAAFRVLKMNYVYVAVQVGKDRLKDAVEIIRNLNIAGVNVTLPHKVAVIKYLDRIDPLAKAIGAVNTIHNKNGKLTGYNTDGIGAVAALKEKIPQLRGKKTLILGAGGAARAIAFQLAKEGCKLVILNRTESKAVELASSLKKKFKTPIVGAKLEKAKLRKELSNSDILINTTLVGMSPNTNATLVTRSLMKPKLTVFDIVYNPIKTRLLKEAEVAGAKTIDGVNMLVYQGAESFKIWTGRNPPIKIMRNAVLKELRRAAE